MPLFMDFKVITRENLQASDGRGFNCLEFTKIKIGHLRFYQTTIAKD